MKFLGDKPTSFVAFVTLVSNRPSDRLTVRPPTSDLDLTTDNADWHGWTRFKHISATRFFCQEPGPEGFTANLH